jgi:hypothetical protein
MQCINFWTWTLTFSSTTLSSEVLQSQIGPLKAVLLNLSWIELVCCLLTEASPLCYRTSWQKSLHFANIFKSVAAKNLLQRWQLTVSVHRRISLLVWVVWLRSYIQYKFIFCLTLILIIKRRSLSSVFIKINYARKQFDTKTVSLKFAAVHGPIRMTSLISSLAMW